MPVSQTDSRCEKKEMWKTFKELVVLWDWLGFYVFMNQWRRASETSNRIYEYEKDHPVLVYVACIANKFV